jgi:signal transduction histidine kinase
MPTSQEPAGIARLIARSTETSRIPPVWIEAVRVAGVAYAAPAIGPAGSQRTVHCASLSPGSYRSLVRAVNADVATGEVPAVLRFEVRPPLWQRWWFVTAAFLAGVSAMGVLNRFCVARLLEMERLRRRIAADLHDDIGASLSRVAILSELVKRQVGPAQIESSRRLSEIAQTARELVDAMSDIVWSVDPRRDNLSNVAVRVRQLAAEVLDDHSIIWKLQAASNLEKIKLNPEQRRHLYLIFKEALTNIARHSGSRSVRLAIRMDGGRIRVEIGDNGHGFDPDAVTGNGLENMRARAAYAGGTMSLESAIGAGTHIQVDIPLKQVSA